MPPGFNVTVTLRLRFSESKQNEIDVAGSQRIDLERGAGQLNPSHSDCLGYRIDPLDSCETRLIRIQDLEGGPGGSSGGCGASPGSCRPVKVG